MKKWVRFTGILLACCVMVNLVPANLLAADAAVRQEQSEGGAEKGMPDADEGNGGKDRTMLPSMTAVTPIYEEDETEQEMDASQESGEPQALADEQTRSADGVYQSGLKIWFDADSGTVTDADEDIKTLDLPQTIGGAEVKAIGKSAFSGCSALPQITLPKSLGSIGDRAFPIAKR